MLRGRRQSPPRSPHPDRCDAVRMEVEVISALPRFAVRNPKTQHSCIGTLTQRPSGGQAVAKRPSGGQAAAKRRPSSAKSHRPPTADAVGRHRAFWKCARNRTNKSHHGCAEHCVPRKPTNASPTCSGTRFAPPFVGSPHTFQHHVSKKHTESRHTDRFSNLQRERWTPTKKRRRAWILHFCTM